MHNVSLSFHHFIPYQTLRFVGNSVCYLVAQLYTGFHYGIHSLKGREIALLSKAIDKLEKNQLDDQLLVELKEMLGDLSPTRESRESCEAQVKLELLTVLKTHRYSVFLLFKGVQASTPLHLPLYRFVAQCQVDASTVHVDPFEKLTITPEQKQLIVTVLETMATKEVSQLLIIRKQLEGYADTLRPLHPLKFLAEAFGQQQLRDHIRAIKLDYLKWNGIPWVAPGFLSKTSSKLDLAHQTKNLVVYLPGFCKILGIKEDGLATCVQNRQWAQFIDKVMEYASHASPAKQKIGSN